MLKKSDPKSNKFKRVYFKMGALFYGNLDEVRSTEQDWFDDEEFEELQLDLKQFDVNITISNKNDLNSAKKVFISFFEKNERSNLSSVSNASSSLKNISLDSSDLQLIGNVTSKFLNGNVFKVTNDDVVWFRLSDLERLPSRSYTSKQIEKLCSELFPKYLTNGQTIYLLTRQPSYDHQFEFYPTKLTNELKEFQKELPIMFTRASEGLLFEYCIKNDKQINVLKLPMLLDEVTALRTFLPNSIYNEISNKNNYLLTSSNLYA